MQLPDLDTDDELFISKALEAAYSPNSVPFDVLPTERVKSLIHHMYETEGMKLGLSRQEWIEAVRVNSLFS